MTRSPSWPPAAARSCPAIIEPTAGENAPAFVLVLEGAARAAIPRLPSARPGATVASPLRPGEVRVVEARGSGDDTIVAVVHELPGRRVVVTADRELRARCAAAGAEILGPGWLLGLLPESRAREAPGAEARSRPDSRIPRSRAG